MMHTQPTKNAAMLAGMAVCLFVHGAAAAPADDGRPNILFLLTDDQRLDTIAALGNPHIQTPHLDRLVAAGTAFSRATCANPICTPSRAEILTGCSGFRNGVIDFGRKIDPELPRFAETLRRAGYHTGYVGKWHNNGRPSDHGYEQTVGLYSGGGGKFADPEAVDYRGLKVTGYRGWVFQTDEGKIFPERGVGLTPTISADFADAAIEFIRQQRKRPYFLHVNFTAPHDPLLMPPGYEERYQPTQLPLPDNFRPRHPFDHGNFEGRDERLLPWPRTPELVRADLAVYYAVISHLDAQVGRIISALETAGQTDNTVVIFASDHGLAMGSHGLRGKQNMYEHTINVPLVISGPNLPKAKREPAQVYLRDLFPTACQLAGVEVPAAVEGKSLVPLLCGKAKELYPEVYGYFRDKQRMVRTDRWKLIYYPHLDKYNLFDLENDPSETNQLVSGDGLGAPEAARAFADLKARLSRWQKRVGDPLAR